MRGLSRHDNRSDKGALDGPPDITTGVGVLGDPLGDEGPDAVGPVDEGSGVCEMMTTGPLALGVGVGFGVDGSGVVGPAIGPVVAPADVGPEL